MCFTFSVYGWPSHYTVGPTRIEGCAFLVRVRAVYGWSSALHEGTLLTLCSLRGVDEIQSGSRESDLGECACHVMCLHQLDRLLVDFACASVRA